MKCDWVGRKENAPRPTGLEYRMVQCNGGKKMKFEKSKKTTHSASRKTVFQLSNKYTINDCD